MKIKREIVARIFADIAKVIFITFVIGRFINPDVISNGKALIAIVVFTVFTAATWVIAPRN